MNIEKEGYDSLTVHVSSQVSGKGAVSMTGNVLVGGLIGAGVDSMTGAIKDLKPNPIKVTLVQAAKPVVAEKLPAVAERARGRGRDCGRRIVIIVRLHVS